MLEPLAERSGVPRLWIAPPYPDETVSSVLDRACAFYCVDRQRLLDSFGQRALLVGYKQDVDRQYATPLVGRVFEGLGGDVRAASWIPDNCLPARSRGQYCAHCFAEDLAAGRSPYFRWQWAIPYVTVCQAHGVPLCVWRHMVRHRRVLPRAWVANPSLQDVGLCSWLEHDAEFGSVAVREDRQALLSAVTRLQGELIPANFKAGGSYKGHARTLWHRVEELIHVGAALTRNTHLGPVASHLRPANCIENLFGTPSPKDQPHLSRNTSTLRRFEGHPSPSWRRSVLWFVARMLKGGDTAVPLVNGNFWEASETVAAWSRLIRPVADPETLPLSIRHVNRATRRA